MFSIFQIEISGKDLIDEQPLNRKLISVTLFIFHFDISGKDFNFTN